MRNTAAKNSKSAVPHQSVHLLQPLLNLLARAILPTLPLAASRLLVATPTHREFSQLYPQLPAEVKVSMRRVRSRRSRSSKANNFQESAWDAAGHITGRWREDGLVVKREPVLVAVVSGECLLTLGDYDLFCPRGTWVLIPPGVALPDGSRAHLDTNFQAQGAEKPWCDVLWIAPWHNVLRCWVCHSEGDKHLPTLAGESVFLPDTHLRNCFNTLMQEAQWHEPQFAEVCAALLQVVFTLLNRLLKSQNFLLENSTILHHERYLPGQDAIERSQQYIRSHLHKSLTLESVARVVYLSRARFASDFHRQTGQTFTTFLTRCRLDHARLMLCETQWQIAFIADSVGLSQSRFNTIFKQTYGTTPGEFRAQFLRDAS